MLLRDAAAEWGFSVLRVLGSAFAHLDQCFLWAPHTLEGSQVRDVEGTAPEWGPQGWGTAGRFCREPGPC